jgi:hypothetical protein
MIHHTAGEPGSFDSDQVCTVCARVLRRRGSQDMFVGGETVGEDIYKGRTVLVASPPGDGISCRFIRTSEQRRRALSGTLKGSADDS